MVTKNQALGRFRTAVSLFFFSIGHSDKMDSGLAVATVSSIGYLGFLIGPPLIGHISHAISLHYTFAVIACVGVIVAVAATRLPIHKQ